MNEKAFRGLTLTQHGRSLTDSTIADFSVPAGAVKFYKGDVIFTGVPGSRFIGAKPATGNYGTTSDFILGIASEDSTNSLTVEHSNFEVYRLRDGQEWECELKDKTIMTTQASVNLLKGKSVKFHYDAVTDKWTVDVALVNTTTNSVLIKEGDYTNGRVRLEYIQ